MRLFIALYVPGVHVSMFQVPETLGVHSNKRVGLFAPPHEPVKMVLPPTVVPAYVPPLGAMTVAPGHCSQDAQPTHVSLGPQPVWNSSHASFVSTMPLSHFLNVAVDGTQRRLTFEKIWIGV
jgi:hypothetical protein